MTPDQEPNPPANADEPDKQVRAGRIAEARSVLAALDGALLSSSARVTRATHDIRFVAAVDALFNDD